MLTHMAYTVKEKNECEPTKLGQTVFHMAYIWDGLSDQVDVLEEEENVGFEWPVPRWEPPRRSKERFTDLPEHIQQEFLNQQSKVFDE